MSCYLSIKSCPIKTMSSHQKIEAFNELLKPFLGSKQLVKYETKRLTAAGDNYGSLMLLISVQVSSHENPSETLEMVAKLPPPNDLMKRVFNSPQTFLNEIAFYKDFVPKIQRFLTDSNIAENYDSFPETYGSRLSFNPNPQLADDDAVLLMENLNASKYVGLSRTAGFDLETTGLILKTLAKFHAVPIAYKLAKPVEFEREIRSLFKPFIVFGISEERQAQQVDYLADCVQEHAGEKYAQRVRELLRNVRMAAPKNAAERIQEPFSTIVHCDLWVNNIMIKFSGTKPAQCKLVDFQLYEYGSPARDLFFLLFSSVQIPVLKEHYEDLIALYHEEFVRFLEIAKCPTEAFSLERFHEEIKKAAVEFEIYHVLFMLDPIFATKENIKELDELREEDFLKKTTKSREYEERMAFLIQYFVDKQWL